MGPPTLPRRLPWFVLSLAFILTACGGGDPQVTAMQVTVADTELAVGQTTQATATVTATGGASESVTWSSSDDAVLSVDASGLVSAVAEGEAQVVATSVFAPAVSGAATVTVVTDGAVTGLTVEGPTHLVVGRAGAMVATVTATGTVDTSVAWSSSDPARLSVDEDGLLHASGVGAATITATSTADPSFSSDHAVVLVATAWDTRAALPVAGGSAASVFADGLLFVIGGGVSGTLAVSDVRAYDPQTNAWSSLADLPQPLRDACAVRLGDAIYVAGGLTLPFTALDTMYRFDLTTQTWALVGEDPLPAARFGAACAVVDGRIYLIGGRDAMQGGDLATLVFDPQAPAGGRWTPDLAAPPVDGGLGAAVAVDDAIYFVGTYSADTNTPQASVARYLPSDDTWDALPELQVPRAGARTWSDGRHLYVAGGEDTDTTRADIEIYDLQDGLDGSWGDGQPMSTARRLFALGYDPATDRVFVAGGGGTASLVSVVERGRGLQPEP